MACTTRASISDLNEIRGIQNPASQIGRSPLSPSGLRPPIGT
jgi:hypothetical protein